MLASSVLDHVKIQIVYSKNLISYLESSLYADQKSSKNHGDALGTSRVTAPQTYREKEKNL